MGLAARANRLGNHARYRKRGCRFSRLKEEKKKKKERIKKDAARIYMYTMFSKIVRDFHFDSNIRGYLVIEM